MTRQEKCSSCGYETSSLVENQCGPCITWAAMPKEESTFYLWHWLKKRGARLGDRRDDFIQEALVRYWEKKDEFQNVNQVRDYLLSTIKGMATRQLKRSEKTNQYKYFSSERCNEKGGTVVGSDGRVGRQHTRDVTKSLSERWAEYLPEFAAQPLPHDPEASIWSLSWPISPRWEKIRRALVWHYKNGLTYSQIAQVEGVRKQLIGMRVKEGREWIREQLS